MMDAGVVMKWGVQIPLRDGIHLNGTLYLPPSHVERSACLCTLTPYVSQFFHDRGRYFAARGFPFLVVDCRGRGNSEGEFRPFIQEADDGYDVIEWLAQQPYCDGKVAMWGGSYGGYVQWATIRQSPPHLQSIVPVSSAYVGIDFPIRSNMASPYWMQWLILVAGRTSQDRLFWGDRLFWSDQFRDWFESGDAFATLDSRLGYPSATFQQWVSHPHLDSYWDSHNPTPAEYRSVSLPVLTITGVYDDDQPGALMHYREHLRNASASAAAQHYLIIGPWDHAGTRTPQIEFGGLKFGPQSLLDIPDLHVQWYHWVLRNGQKPPFLKNRVAYYVAGADTWRYSDTLEAATATTTRYALHSTTSPVDLFASGSIVPISRGSGGPDSYVYDPSDTALARLESTVDPEDYSDQRMLHAAHGRRLVYHSEPFGVPVEITGFFKLTAWLAIDQLDTDFQVSIHEIQLDGTSILLSSDRMRARYRQDSRSSNLIQTCEPLLYEFNHLTFVSRLIQTHSRLRLVIGPIHSIYSQRNFNTGGEISRESIELAKPVTVQLFHDERYSTVLEVPLGHPDASPSPRTPECVLPTSGPVA